MAEAVFSLHSALLPSLSRLLAEKQCWGQLVLCRDTPAKASPTRDWAPLSLAAVLGAAWPPACQPSCPLPSGTSRSLFCTEATGEKVLHENLWQMATLEKLLLALSSSSHSFRFLQPSTHSPPQPRPAQPHRSQPAPACPRQCRAVPWGLIWR